MAYREFQNEKVYEAPNIGDLPRTLDAVRFVEQQKALQQRQAYDLLKAHKTLTGEGKVLKYVQGVNELGQEGTRRVQNDIFNHGKITPETQSFLDEGLQLKAEAKSNENKLNDINKRILETAQQDQFYVPTGDIKKVGHVLTHDNTTPFNRDLINQDQQKIVDLDKNVYSDEDVLQNFNAPKAADEWIKGFKQKTFEQSNKDLNGIKKGNTVAGLFFDEKGNRGITDQTLNDFFQFHPKQKPYYAQLAMHEIMDDVSKAKADNPNFMKGMSDGEILSTLIQRPDLNPIDQRSVAERARDRAKTEIKNRESIIQKVDTDFSSYNQSSKYGANKESSAAQGFFNGNNSGLGMTIQFKDKPITYNIKPSHLIDPTTGKAERNADDKNFIAHSYKIGVKDAGGNILPIQADSYEDFVKQLKELPDKFFINASPTWLADGFIVDKHSVASAQKKLREEPQTPENQRLQEQLDKIDVDVDAADVIKNKLGIDVLRNKLINISNDQKHPDAIGQKLKSDTGIDLYSQKIMNGENKEIFDLIQKRVKEATPKAEEEFKKMIDQKAQESGKKNAFTTEKVKVKKTKSPHGDEVEQDGVTYIWDGEKYVAK